MNTKTLTLNNDDIQVVNVDIPTNTSFKFMNIQNTTDYLLEIVHNNITIITIQPLTDISVTIPNEVSEAMRFVFTKKLTSSFSSNVCIVNFAQDSLNYNSNSINLDNYKLAYEQSLPSNMFSYGVNVPSGQTVNLKTLILAIKADATIVSNIYIRNNAIKVNSFDSANLIVTIHTNETYLNFGETINLQGIFKLPSVFTLRASTTFSSIPHIVNCGIK